MKIAILGNLAGVANELLIGLRERGIEADLYISHSDKRNTLDDMLGQECINKDWIHFLEPELPGARCFSRWFIYKLYRAMFWRLGTIFRLCKYDLIHSHTGSLNFSPLAYFLFVKLHIKKYFAVATGSDLREVAQYGKGVYGHLMRMFFSQADQVLLLNADMTTFKKNIGLPRAVFFPFIINEAKHAPKTDIAKPLQYADKLLCFMMSHLDFGATDYFENRSSMKNNDRFFYALAKFVEVDSNIHVIVLDRGPDKDIAKKIVSDLRIEQYVTFHPPMIELERIRHLNMADVVIDQFSIGSFGLGALETLSVGKPLITYIREDCIAECYGDELPILNAHTTEEILQRLFEARNETLRQSLSTRAREWIIKHHSRDVVINELLKLYRDTLSTHQ